MGLSYRDLMAMTPREIRTIQDALDERQDSGPTDWQV